MNSESIHIKSRIKLETDLHVFDWITQELFSDLNKLKCYRNPKHILNCGDNSFFANTEPTMSEE